MKTGISPLELLKTPPEILEVMIKEVWPTDHIKSGGDAWQSLEKWVTE